MDEMRVSATDFRVHLKDLGNQVARGGAAIIVSRHGLELGAFINLDDYEEFLRWRKSQGEKPAPVEVPPEHPDELPIEEVERLYKATAMATDDETLQWRSRAYLSIRARTRRYPDEPS